MAKLYTVYSYEKIILFNFLIGTFLHARPAPLFGFPTVLMAFVRNMDSTKYL
jgi:hypothetical protein